jgi:peptidyl-prolyl cis-trans isomerase SurA
MNKHLFPVPSSVGTVRLVGASLCLALGCLALTSHAQAPQVQAAPAAANVSLDFIVAVVNSEPITHQEVLATSMRLQRETAAQGRPMGAAQANQLALEQLINDKAQIQQARDAGIVVDEAALDQAEESVAVNNQISREALRQRLQQDGISVSAFRDQLRNQLLLTRVREREVEARIRISDIEVEQFLQEQLQAQAVRAPVELNLAMILIAVPENSSEAQIKPLEAQAREVARRARSGESFAELAKTFSQTADRGANGGALGLRPADRYPELFVQAVAAVPVGGVSEVLRSGAGFHVLKVLERQQAPATLMVTQTRARHILLRLGPQLTQAQALAQLSALRLDIVSGKADFAEVARRLSQDGSAAQGGDLGWASPGMFVPEFEQAMNRLRPGQVAEPLVSRFGVHLIEVTDRRDAPMSDAEQRALARNVLREKKLDEAYVAWAEDVRGRAYVEMREPVQ